LGSPTEPCRCDAPSSASAPMVTRLRRPQSSVVFGIALAREGQRPGSLASARTAAAITRGVPARAARDRARQPEIPLVFG
jgi:hypothetical protein